ncbi:MAG: ergothioneine biosynthesis protein EgtB [Vulcanimicrobiaceae bacterium]
MTELPNVERAGAGETMISLLEARSRTLALAADLRDDQFTVPKLEVINPILWELGHIAYFAEFWILRQVFGEAPLLANSDAWYDSAKIAHDVRWSLPLPPREQTLAFMQRELERVAEAASRPHPQAQYFYELALRHEDMHAEAFVYTRQLLGYPTPSYVAPKQLQGGPLAGDVRIGGGSYLVGSLPEDGFVFDNEKWAHEVELAPFAIARAPVTNAEFAAFIAEGGYTVRRYWSDDGWNWLQARNLGQPLYWNLEARTRRSFDRDVALRDHEPVCNVSKFEAEAYCAWAGRRLPTEPEWEVAATGGERKRFPWGDQPAMPGQANLDGIQGGPCDVSLFASGESVTGCRQMIGNVWEWTSSRFEPYAGFVVDPYAEYSEPWFGTHYVLRGGAWTTRNRLISTRWRNFYRPHRQDVMAGFRTVKL